MLRARESCARAAFGNALAVRRQIERLREFDLHDAYERARREADTQFLLVAMWRLRIAAEMAQDLVDHSPLVTEALSGFDEAFPRLRNLRHVLMHYDNYLLENTKRRNARNDAGDLVGRTDVESLFNSPDGVSWLGEDYWFDRIDAESTELYRVVTDVLGTSGAT